MSANETDGAVTQATDRAGENPERNDGIGRDVAGPPRVTAGSKRPTSRLSRGSLVIAWLVLILIFAVLEPATFLTSGTFNVIFGSQQALLFLSMAALCAFTVAEFDLSIAANLGLAGTIVAVLVANQHVNVVLASVIAVAASVLVGAVNAVIVVALGINAIVTTLGMATLVTGVALRLSNSSTVSGLSPGFAKIANTPLLGLPITFYYGLLIVLAFFYVLRFTPLGRHMAFVGSNRSVARLAGVHVTRIRVGAYLSSGLLCGVGGVVLAAGIGGFDPASSSSYLLPALSATFLGTAAIEPGRFNPLGTFIAIFFLATGIVGLQLFGLAGWISDVFYGAALIIGVIFSSLTRNRLLSP